MAITKLGSNVIKDSLKTSGKFNFGSPLGAGFMAFGVGSGQSLGESAGMGLGGYASYDLAQKGAKKLLAKPKVSKFLPGRLGKTVGFIGALGSSFIGSDIGKRIGQKVPIYKRSPKDTTVR